MTIGQGSDFKIYDELVLGAMIERQQQNINMFNAASRNTLRLSQAIHQGNFVMESFFKKVQLVTRRVLTSLSPVADTPLTQGENVTVKVNRRIGPVSHTMDAFKKIKRPANIDSISVALGAQVADDMTADMLNTGLASGVAALKAQASNYLVASNKLKTLDLVHALAKMGDKADRVVAWVMHSAPFYDLVGDQITANITGVSNFAVATAMPVTLNRPVLITDSPSLQATGVGSPPSAGYVTLGLVEDAINVEDSEEQTFWSQEITGLQQLAVRYQGEYAFNLGVKGFTWDVGNGGINPADAALATGGNWDKTATSFKDLAGVALGTF